MRLDGRKFTPPVFNPEPFGWKVEHDPSCPVTTARAQLVADLAIDPRNEYLLGAVPEYDEGGDQEVELCECHV